MNDEITTGEKVAVAGLGFLSACGLGYLFYKLLNSPKEKKPPASKAVGSEKATVSISDENDQPWTLDGSQGEPNDEGEFVYRWTYRYSGGKNPIYPDGARMPVRLSTKAMTVEEAKRLGRKEIASLVKSYVEEAKSTPFPFL